MTVGELNEHIFTTTHIHCLKCVSEHIQIYVQVCKHTHFVCKCVHFCRHTQIYKEHVYMPAYAYERPFDTHFTSCILIPLDKDMKFREKTCAMK